MPIVQMWVSGYTAVAQNVGGGGLGSNDGPLRNFDYELHIPQHDYQDIVGFRTGDGVQFRGKRDRDVWFHFPVPTPTTGEIEDIGAHPQVLSVSVLWQTTNGAVLQHLHAWDGARARIFQQNDLNVSGDFTGTDEAEPNPSWHRKLLRHKNYFVMDPPMDIFYGLGISANIRFASDSDNGVVRFTGAGAAFHIE